MRICTLVLLCLFTFLSTPYPATASEADASAAFRIGATPPDDEADAQSTQRPTDLSAELQRALELLSQQQEALDQQAKTLDEQQAALDAANVLITQQGERIDRLEASLDELQGQTTDLVGRIDIVAPTPSEPMPTPTITEEVVDEDQPTAADVAAAEKTDVKEVEDDPTRVILESLPGAMRLPGTNTVMRWGGFAKSTVVSSLDPLATSDRFITGAIPVSEVSLEEETTITVAQSRINLDMREPTDVGLLRAFIEGDFDGNGETFRLRHAFGQRGNVLGGKTWSTFVDRSASPEEVDFEGLNGRINVRQAQIRFQPKIGEKFEFMFSVEDPNPAVTNGDGVSEIPDLVMAARANRRLMHLRLATLLRQVRAQPVDDPENTVDEWGWATSLSGRIDVPLFHPRDALLFQVNYGSGYGQYVNDLREVGDFDGYITEDGDLELIDVLSGYVSAQHWWSSSFRSNVTLGFVELDNPEEVPGDFYKRTLRASANLFWTPTPRFNLAAELLWGERENEDGSDGDASQFQLAAKYLF